MASKTEGTPPRPSSNEVANTFQERLEASRLHNEVYTVGVGKFHREYSDPIASIYADTAVQVVKITADIQVTVTWPMPITYEEINDLRDHLEDIFVDAEIESHAGEKELTLQARVLVNQGVITHSFSSQPITL